MIHELRNKRKIALIAVLTLGFASTPIRDVWNSVEMSKGMSFEGTMFADFWNVFWKCLFVLAVAGIIWVINIFKLIYYSIEIAYYKRKYGDDVSITMSDK